MSPDDPITRGELTQLYARLNRLEVRLDDRITRLKVCTERIRDELLSDLAERNGDVVAALKELAALQALKRTLKWLIVAAATIAGGVGAVLQALT